MSDEEWQSTVPKKGKNKQNQQQQQPQQQRNNNNNQNQQQQQQQPQQQQRNNNYNQNQNRNNNKPNSQNQNNNAAAATNGNNKQHAPPQQWNNNNQAAQNRQAANNQQQQYKPQQHQQSSLNDSTHSQPSPRQENTGFPSQPSPVERNNNNNNQAANYRQAANNNNFQQQHKPQQHPQMPNSMNQQQSSLNDSVQRDTQPSPRLENTVLPNQPSSVEAPIPVAAVATEVKTSTITSEPDQQQQQIQIAGLSADLQNFPKRPQERCTLGRDIRLTANHYAFRLNRAFSISHYDINIFEIVVNKQNEETNKEIKSKEVSKHIFEELCKNYPNQKDKMVYDNKKSLYSMEPLQSPIELKLKCAKLNNRQYLIKIKKVNDITIDPNQVMDQVAVQILQLIFTHNLNYRYVSVMRSFFSENSARKELGFNLDLWKGFYVSVRPSEMGFNLNVDVANSAFFRPGVSILDLACDWYGCYPKDLQEKFDYDYNGYSFADLLKGKKVKTHLNYTKRVDGIGPAASKHKFTAGKETLTIQQYFQKQGITLKYPNLPCLDLGKQNYTPLELCKTELANVKKLDAKQTSDMIRATAIHAAERQRDINSMITGSNLDKDPILKNYNIDLQLKMVELKGKVVNSPELEYGQRKITSSDITRRGQWDNINKSFFDAKRIDNWIVFNFGSHRLTPDTVSKFIGTLKNVGKLHGLLMNDPLDLVAITPRTVDGKAREILQKSVEKCKDLQFVFIILAGKTSFYNIFKTFFDVNIGIPSQAIDESTITKQRQGYDKLASNLCLKINAKLGGRNFKINRNESLFQKYLQQLYDGPLMVFGADVNHPSPLTGSKDLTESIAAVVGSIDLECCYYAARIRAQQQPKGKSLEYILDLNIMVEDLLREYHKANGSFPKRIVFLRDGVSEGQFKMIRRHEMNEIRTACQKINVSYKPAVSFVVVQKRHHTRFFPMDQRDESGKCGNVPPGTLVDCKIITPDMFDFFLCSHLGIQGTSKPCHYFILHDENNFSMNQIALLCHYLCHIYARSTTSVSYPAPTYYADLCAERGRCYTRQTINSNQNTLISVPVAINESFKNRMFFI